jgi:hypothetical protein
MESTISTKNLKSKLDGKEKITVVETLAPGRWFSSSSASRFCWNGSTGSVLHPTVEKRDFRSPPSFQPCRKGECRCIITR